MNFIFVGKHKSLISSRLFTIRDPGLRSSEVIVEGIQGQAKHHAK